MSARPSLGRSQPPATLSRVDFPAPEGPATPSTVRGATVTLTSLSAGRERPSKRTVTPCSATPGGEQGAGAAMRSAVPAAAAAAVPCPPAAPAPAPGPVPAAAGRLGGGTVAAAARASRRGG